jgi:hypothetical protein
VCVPENLTLLGRQQQPQRPAPAHAWLMPAVPTPLPLLPPAQVVEMLVKYVSAVRL